MKLYAINIIEVLMHRTFIEAANADEAKALACQQWDKGARYLFDTSTAGRSHHIACREEMPETEVAP